MYEINQIVSELLAETTEYHPLCDAISRDYDYFESVYGTLTQENAILLIQQSLLQKNLFSILSCALYFSDSQTISNAVFKSICSYPGAKKQKTLLKSIAHCPISFYQLQEICKRKICVEAFASLVVLYVQNPCFTVWDLQKLVGENMDFLVAIDWKGVLRDCAIDNHKREYIKTIMV